MLFSRHIFAGKWAQCTKFIKNIDFNTNNTLRLMIYKGNAIKN